MISAQNWLSYRPALVLSASAAMLAAVPASAQDQIFHFNIAPQSLATAILEFSRQTGEMVVVSPSQVAGKRAKKLRGTMSSRAAIDRLLADSGLHATASLQGGYLIKAGAASPFGKPQQQPASMPSHEGTRALAQAPADFAEQAPPTAVDSNVIIVTAQRREEALEDVPMSITALTPETMAAAGVVSMRDLQSVTTGYTLAQGGTAPQPAIRGVTTIVAGVSFENNVGVYIDGLYQVTPLTLNIDLPDVESIQILKGPQGALYGRNATGGAILINTIMPKNSWVGKAEFTYGRFDDKRASGYIAGPITDEVGVSLAGYTKRSDGWVKLLSRTVPGRRDGGNAIPQAQDAVRAKIAADLTDNFKATLGYSYSYVSSAASAVFANIENTPPYIVNPAAAAVRPVNIGDYAYDIGIAISAKKHEGWLALALDTSIGTLKTITGYTSTFASTHLDFDASYVNSGYTIAQARQKTLQQSVDFTMDAVENLDLLVGGTYFRDRIRTPGPNHSTSFTGIDPAASAAIPKTLADVRRIRENRFTQDKDAWAIYADATFHVSDRFTVNAGGRYSEETIDVTAVGYALPSGNAVFPFTSKGSKYTRFTPRASIRYEIAPRTNIYASYSQGFKSGAWNAGLPPTPAQWVDAKQEEVQAYEVGFKTAANDLRFEMAAFYYDYTNLQVSRSETINGLSTVIVTNSPSAEIYGVEASFDAEILKNFRLRGGATWLHARYGKGFLFDGLGVDPARQGINSNADPLKTFLNAVDPNQDLSGTQMIRAPDFSAFLGFDYRIPNGDGGFLFAGNLKYTDSYVVSNPSLWGRRLIGTQYADRAGDQRFRQGNYFLLNASATWTDPTDTFYARLWGANLTDTVYILHYSGSASNGTYSPIAERRSYGVTLGYKFRQ